MRHEEAVAMWCTCLFSKIAGAHLNTVMYYHGPSVQHNETECTAFNCIYYSTLI